VETQILHFDGVEWQPYTYEWNDDQTDARLLDAAGGERIFEVIDPQAAGGKRRQTWRFSGRAECQRCHNKWSGPVLAFNTVQLNKLHDFGGSEIPQLEGLLQLGLLETPIPDDQRPRLADPHDASAPLDDRARAYLHTNCAHCHRLHAGGSVLSKMQFDLPLDKTDLLGARPTQGTFAIHGAQVVSPGDPFRSVLFYRMAKLGGGRMPHLGSTEVDREGVRLISLWIQGLPANAAEAASGEDAASKLRTEETQRVQRLRVAVDESERDQLVESLMSTTSGALRLLQDLDSGQLPPQVAATVVDVGSAHEQVNVRDLFERFLPPEQRVRRLGSIVQAEQILALPGDADRGRRLFLETEGVQCKNCHRVQQQGKELGPDLSTIGRQNSREQLLESILEPSKRIDPKFVSYLLETDDGRVITGLLVSRDEREIVLKDAQNMELRFAADHIERLVPQQPSLMPELLFRDMTAQQLADLIEFLGSLK
jgi:putative heme-binding domain-containing protein